jgi:hypothetical protein
MKTVIIKPIPNARDTSLRRLFSITMFPEYSVEEDSNSDVIKRMIAIMANQRLMSDIDSGKFIFSALQDAIPHFDCLTI